jgi:hypothetical protein
LGILVWTARRREQNILFDVHRLLDGYSQWARDKNHRFPGRAELLLCPEILGAALPKT